MRVIKKRFGAKRTTLAMACMLTALSGYSNAVDGLLVPDDGVLFTIGQDVDSINNYVSSVGVQPGGVTNYVGIVNLDGLDGNADAGAGRNNITELAATYPDSALVIGVSMNGQVNNVAAGQYNNNIDYLLNKLGQYNRPVYLRWAYEVDGPWNGHNPADLITSFRYVHQRIQDLGYDDRIAMVWQVASYCPNPAGQLNSWYPGDQYVDWIGLSYFSPQDCNWDRVNEAAEFARTHNKPLFINESTPQRYQISDLNYSTDPAQGSNRMSKTAQQIWDEWYGNYFNFINRYSDVLKGITYINADWDQQTRWGDFGDGYGEGYWGDSRVQANPTILNNWLNETNKDKYIKLTSDLYSRLNFGDDNTGGGNTGGGNTGGGDTGGGDTGGGSTGGGNTGGGDTGGGNTGGGNTGGGNTGGGSQTLEAESASLANGASVYSDSSASGGSGVAYLSSNNASMTLSNVPAASSVQVNYASERSGGISVYINGSDAGTLSFNSTGSWVGNYNTATVNVNVPAGATFELRFNNGDAALNVDSITFIGSAVDGSDTGTGNTDTGGGDTNTGGDSNSGGNSGSGDTGNTGGSGNSGNSGNSGGNTDGNGSNGGTSQPGNGEFSVIRISANSAKYSFAAEADWPTSGTFYNCKNGDADCYPADLNDGRWEYTHNNLTQGQEYKAVLKVPGMGAQDFPTYTFTWQDADINAGGNSNGDTGGSNSGGSDTGNGNTGGSNSGGSDTGSGNTGGGSDTGSGDTGSGDTGGDTNTGGSDNNGSDSGDNNSGGDTNTGGNNTGGGDTSGGDTGSSGGDSNSGGDDDGSDGEEPVNENYGVEVINNTTALYWVKNDPQWGGGDYYSCKNGDADCYRAELVDGRWEREHNNMSSGATYNAVLKVPGMGADQYPSWSFVWEGDGTSPAGSGGSAGGSSAGGKNNQVVAASVAEVLPALDYGYESGLGNFLVGGIGAGADHFGFTLYTFAPDVAGSGTSNCEDCEAWPALTVESEEALVPLSRLKGDIGTITLSDGSKQVTYNGKPLYFRAADSIPGQTDGANDSWPVATVNVDPVPSQLYTRALKTPSNMKAPTNGFGFNISGNSVTWEFGPVLSGVSGPNVSFHCTPDQVSFFEANLSSGQAAIPASCANSDTYWYFFQYELKNPGAGKYVMDNNYDFDPASAYRYTALYVNDGTRIDLSRRPEFKDTGANWMRFRHPRAYDGVTEAIRDATHNSSRVAELARYSIDAIETTAGDGSVNLVLDLNLPMSYTGQPQGLVRLEGLQKWCW